MDSTTAVPYFPPPPSYLNIKKSRIHSPAATIAAGRTPKSLRRSRKFIFPILLILSFGVAILSAIYTYCIASPHTRLTAADYANNPNVEVNDSIFRRDDTSSATGTTITSPTPALIFYTLTTPVVTIALILIELATHIFRPQLNHNRLAHLLWLTSALLLVTGWLTTALLWTHCEISPFHHAVGAQAVCPASVRGHFMWGIHELSIAKVGLALLLVGGWLVHALFVGISLRRLQQRVKAAAAGEESSGLGLRHGEAQMVLEREMEEGLKVQSDLRKGMKKSGQKVRIAE